MPLAPETAGQHQEAANSLMIQIREFQSLIPGFTHLPAERRRKITVSANMPDELLQAAGVACDAHQQLAAASELTGAACRGEVAFTAGYNAVATELEILARGIRDAALSRRYDIVQRALRAYNMAKRLNRPEDREVLIPHIQAMARIFSRSKARTTPAAPPSPGGTAPGATTPAK